MGELEENDLKSIADTVKTYYGEDLNDIEVDIIELEGKKENTANRTDQISETQNERRGKYASADAVYDYGQKIKTDAKEYTDSLEIEHNKRFNTVEANLGTIQTELTKQLSEIEDKVEKDIQTLGSNHDKRINTVEEDIIELEDKKENAANRTDKISETQNERRGKYASAGAVYDYGQKIKDEAKKYTDDMFDDVVVQFEKADEDIRSDVANVRTLANDAYNIARGASRAIAFENYQKFCEYILAEGMAFKENYPIGTTILIATSGVPDLWYYEEADDYRGYIPSDNEIMNELANYGYVHIGHYKFAEAETSKMIMDGYVQLGDFLDHSQDKDIHTTREEKRTWSNKLEKANDNGGFLAGDYLENEYNDSLAGVVIGKNAYAEQYSNVSPVVIGEGASSNDGVAIGYKAAAIEGGTSIGVNAIGGGVSIGYDAKAIGDVDVVVDGEVVETLKDYPIDAIQLGSGTNKNKKTLQVYEYQLLDAEGNIPKERLKNAGGGGGSVDLSDYFTKDETTRIIDGEISNVYGAIEDQVKIIDKEKEDVSNKANSITDNGSNSEKYPTTKAVYEYGQGIEQASATYTEAYVAQEIGNIETALEEIIAKYGLGGDAT